MSSDETDEEESSSRKVIRRVRLPWVATEVSLLWKRVESYNTSKQASSLSRGNKAHLRRFEAGRVSQRSAVAELPKNFYDSLWWHKLHPSDRAYLQAKEDTNVPDAEQYVKSHFSNSFVLTIIAAQVIYIHHEPCCNGLKKSQCYVLGWKL